MEPERSTVRINYDYAIFSLGLIFAAELNVFMIETELGWRKEENCVKNLRGNS